MILFWQNKKYFQLLIIMKWEAATSQKIVKDAFILYFTVKNFKYYSENCDIRPPPRDHYIKSGLNSQVVSWYWWSLDTSWILLYIKFWEPQKWSYVSRWFPRGVVSQHRFNQTCAERPLSWETTLRHFVCVPKCDYIM